MTRVFCKKNWSKTLVPAWNMSSNILLPPICSCHRLLCSMTKLKEHTGKSARNSCKLEFPGWQLILTSAIELRKCLWPTEVCANDTCLPENAVESCWGLNGKFNYSLMQIGLAKFSDVNKIGQVCSPPPLPCVDLTAIKAEAWLHRLSPNVPPLPFIYSYCLLNLYLPR